MPGNELSTRTHTPAHISTHTHTHTMLACFCIPCSPHTHTRIHIHSRSHSLSIYALRHVGIFGFRCNLLSALCCLLFGAGYFMPFAPCKTGQSGTANVAKRGETDGNPSGLSTQISPAIILCQQNLLRPFCWFLCRVGFIFMFATCSSNFSISTSSCI